jgi:hypothetical protein
MCDLFGAKKAAKINAAATLKSAEDQAKANRLAAQAAQQSNEITIAQSQAASAARELLDVPMDQAVVDIATGDDAPEIDPVTGRRRTRRAAFMANVSSGSGIQLN